MEDYRLLSDSEIVTLEENGCQAENWNWISVTEGFSPAHIRNVRFYGDIIMGVFDKEVEVSEGFFIHSGIRNATLRNTSIGDNCLIENIANGINNYCIGNDCIISNVAMVSAVAGATYGQGNVIAVLNEAGDGNVTLCGALTSQIAALMVRYSQDSEISKALHGMAAEHARKNITERGIIGDGVKITNTGELTNTLVSDYSEINGARKINECSIIGSREASVFIGNGVICENTIVTYGSSVLNNAIVENCYVGEACCVTNAFSAESSIFFANSFMGNGEACAAFCGPFSISHHKSSLLIGGMFSFYNAGSGTNFSNHAYKMGPIHYGTLERGCKTASGSHLLMPAEIGAFSVCLGKISCHPNTTALPFSYVIANGEKTFIVPGINLTTVGLYRDVRKWRKRDMRPAGGKKSTVNFDWLNPHTVNEIRRGLKLLRTLQKTQAEETEEYLYNGCVIRRSALQKGLALYSFALRLFIRQEMSGMQNEDIEPREHKEIMADGMGEWFDLAGMMIPETEENQLTEDIKNGIISDITELDRRLKGINNRYAEYKKEYALGLVRECYDISDITSDDWNDIEEDCEAAHQEWISKVRQDAEKEYQMGDVAQATLEKFLAELE